MKKSICLILSLILVFSSLPLQASAMEPRAAVPLVCSACPEKQSYKKGEEIRINATVQNTSLDALTDVRVWMDYPQTDYYLTPGVTERFVSDFAESKQLLMRVSENERVLQYAAKFENTKLIKSFLLKLAHAYKLLTLAYATVRYRIQNAFVSLRQENADLATVSVLYDNTPIEFRIKCRYSVTRSETNEAEKLSNEAGAASANVKAVKNSYTGLTFAMNDDKTEFGLFAINPSLGKARLYRVKDGQFNWIASKDVSVEAGRFYPMKVLFDGSRVLCTLSDNPHDTDPYPVFDLYYDADETGYGVFCRQGSYESFAVTAGQIPTYDKTYTNPVYANAPDPYVLKDNGTYYLYATTDPLDGFRVSSSTDLVNWKDLGLCARKGDIYGGKDFWAPEVYSYRGKYYLLYSADEHLALAVSDAPTGPFVKTQDSYLLEDRCIDGHFFFDDDGSIYLYIAYFVNSCEEIWGCRMEPDLSGIVPGTLTRLTSCQKDEGRVNEGPFMLKYQGKYFLTYSINGYTEHNYSVRLAVADSPLGTYNAKGTILQKSGPLVGTGHHSFTTSPDGTELIIVYHCHYSTTQIHARKLCIDRCKFVETDDGYTISVYGPTSAAQPYPSGCTF